MNLLGWLAAAVGVGLTLPPLLREGWGMGGFGAVYLVLGVAAGLVLSLPRLLRWRGAEARWVSVGVGLLTPALLPPERKAEVSFHLTNGLL